MDPLVVGTLAKFNLGANYYYYWFQSLNSDFIE